MAVRMAKRYLGLCPECKGMVNFGHMYRKRNGNAYHADCDPSKPPPQCWCGGEIGETETEHQECFNKRADAFVLTRAVAGIFSPPPVAKLPRFRQ